MSKPSLPVLRGVHISDDLVKKGRGFLEFRTACKGCLYGPNPVVPRKRVRELQREVILRGVPFLCHRSSMAGLRSEIACASWAARHGDTSHTRRFALMYPRELHIIVEQPTDEECRHMLSLSNVEPK